MPSTVIACQPKYEITAKFWTSLRDMFCFDVL